MEKIKVVCFSDTHGLHRGISLPDVDIAIFAGDCMSSGYHRKQLEDFLEWYSIQIPEVKIMVAGNHDRWIEKNPNDFKSMLKQYPGITYLDKTSVQVGSLKIYGIPDTHYFFDWAFNRSQDELEEIAINIPNDTNILITHGPAFGVLDALERGERVGEPQWTDKIPELENLILHVSGHIHCAYGRRRVGFIENADYVAVNCAVLNEQYQLQNEPIIEEILLEV